MDEYIEVSAKTVSEALADAQIKLGATSDQIEYEVIEKGSSGFLGFGNKPAVIRVRRKKPVEESPEISVEEEAGADAVVEEEETPVSESEKSEPSDFYETEKEEFAEEAGTADTDSDVLNDSAVSDLSAEEAARSFLESVLDAMGVKAELDISTDASDHSMDIDIEGENMGILIGKRGQTLDSLQYLTSLVVNKHSSQYIRVRMDTENYRERRKETLENLAKNIAYKVKKTRRPVSLEPMNPYERRIIHFALQNDPYVTTYSEGEEPYRHVVVALKK